MWIGIILGFPLGFVLAALLTAGKITDLEDEKYHAELRATIHFKKLMEIQRIINIGEDNHEFITETHKKIKNILSNNHAD